MMGLEDIKEKVLSFFQNNFCYSETVDDISPEESLIDNGYIDSTGIIGLVTYLERAFNIKVYDSEIVSENFDTLNNIMAYVHHKVEGSASARIGR